MRSMTGNSLKWAGTGAILALILSLLTLPLPWSMGGYNDWTDWHLALHNIAAILTRVAVFAAIGAALGGVSGRLCHRRRPGSTKLQR